MNEDFVTYELAVKLKEKGFDIPFYFFYRSDDKLIHHAMVTKPLVYCDKIDDEVVCAPTISQVLKWLRNEKKIYCLPYFEQGIDMWLYAICKPVYGCEFPEFISESIYDSYEQAALAGIEYVIDNLI